jgi:thiol-disulfide isomerase/thioredoxin
MKRLAAVFVLLAALSCKRAEQPQKPATGTATNAASGQTTAETQTAPAGSTDVGAAMPEYTATGLDGSKFDLAAQRDKVVLLNVWATWCQPCRFEIPELQLLHERYGPRGFAVLGVSVDESGVESVKAFIAEQKKMAYPVVLDPAGKIADLLQTTVLPTSVLIDRSGKILWKKVGIVETNEPELTKAIEAAL